MTTLDGNSLDQLRHRSGETTLEVLSHLARVVNGANNLTDALEFVTSTTRELLGASRASVLLLDGNGVLVPALSAGPEEDRALHQRFRAMAPISATLTPKGRDLLGAGRAVAIAQAGESPLIPAEWQRAFDLASLALVPIVSAGRPCGILVVEPHPGAEITHEQLLTLEAITASASIAVREAQAYAEGVRRSWRHERAATVAVALGSASDIAGVARSAIDGLCDVLESDSGSVHLVRRSDGFTTLCVRGTSPVTPGWHRYDDCAPHARKVVQARWREHPSEPVVLREAGTAVVLVPMAERGEVRGVLVVRRRAEHPPGTEALRLAKSLAAQTWLALDRVRLATLVQGGDQTTAALNRVRESLRVRPEIGALVEGLAEAVHTATGGTLTDARLVGRAAASHLGARVPGAELTAALRRWARTAEPEPVLLQGVVVVPMLHDGKVVGTLTVRPQGQDLTAPDEARFLLALARGAAELAVAVVRRHADEMAERKLALAEERDRVCQALHHDVGRMLSAGADLLRSTCQHPGELGRHSEDIAGSLLLVTSARKQLRATAQGLQALRTSGRGLVGSLRGLAEVLAQSTGAAVQVRVLGEPRALDAHHEGVLLRVAHEVVVHVERSSRASSACLTLRYSPEAVELSVRDNGISLSQRSSSVGLLGALRAMQARIAELGGELVLASPPLGVEVTALLPAPPR